MTQTGLHLHLTTTIADLITTANKHELTALQFFLFNQKTAVYTQPTNTDRSAIKSAKAQNMVIVAHGSYQINLATNDPANQEISRRVLEKELMVAQDLGINYLVLHAGYASGPEALSTAATNLNRALKHSSEVTIILENTAFSGACIGSKFEELSGIRALVHEQERIMYCLDTAHAHAFGYDLHDTSGFFTIVDKILGFEYLALLHINDSGERQGTRRDRHRLPGNGQIGAEALQALVGHPKLSHLPRIIEYPQAPLEAAACMVTKVQKW